MSYSHKSLNTMGNFLFGNSSNYPPGVTDRDFDSGYGYDEDECADPDEEDDCRRDDYEERKINSDFWL